MEEVGELSKECDNRIASTLKAAAACRVAVHAFLLKQNASNYSALKRKLQKLGREIDKIPAPIWIDEPDGQRLSNPMDACVLGIVGPHCFTAFRQWAEIIDALESGDEVSTATAFDPWPTGVAP